MDYENMAKKEEYDGAKALKGGFFSNMFGSKNERVENGIECYKRAANYYKLASKFEEAAVTYQRMANLAESISELDDAADFLNKGGDLYMNVNSYEAGKMFTKAAGYFEKAGKIANAAKVYRTMAEAYETDLEYAKAIPLYERAGELFALEKHHGQDSFKSNLKVATLLSTEPDIAKEEDLVKAIKIYDKVASKYLENNLLRHSAKDLWIKVLLIFICLEDDVGYERSLEKYNEDDPSMSNNYELKALKKIHSYYISKDSDGFSQASMDWHSKSNLDKWKTNILSVIKRKIEKKNPSKKNKKDSEDQFDDNSEKSEDYNPY